MNGKGWLTVLGGGKGRAFLAGLYGEAEAEDQRRRYGKLLEGLMDKSLFPGKEFPEAAGDVRLFTAPGRTELGGNHTDHNRGKVLAASIQLDAVAAAAPRGDHKIFFRSAGFPDVSVDISSTAPREEEKGSTEALFRGIAAGFAERGIPVKGWTANAASTVLPGSGLSSSAALEVLGAKIFDGLYGGGGMSAVDLAKIAQKAENLYYGKPSGLMDQMASASGGAVAIDFALDEPEVTGAAFDPGRLGYTLCVVNTGGSHADLTGDYAAIPREMRSLAAFFGAENLRALGRETLTRALSEPGRISALRKSSGERAILRALHFFDENDRVDRMRETLEGINAFGEGENHKAEKLFDAFLDLVNASGASSWELLQNIYSPRAPDEQGLALALALTRNFAPPGGRKIACRVHGGGFAGTIQAYIPGELFSGYKSAMEAVFGSGAVTALKIRNTGAAEIKP